MKAGSVLSKLFDDTKIDLEIDNELINRNIQFDYGDSKELAKWVIEKKNSAKYPLIWCVESSYVEENDFYRMPIQLIIFQSTQIDWFNRTREVKTYEPIINPVFELMKKKLERAMSISIVGRPNEQFYIKDEPNYGVATDGLTTSQTDFVSKNTKGDESITIDIVDSKIVQLEIRIRKTNCIKL